MAAPEPGVQLLAPLPKLRRPNRFRKSPRPITLIPILFTFPEIVARKDADVRAILVVAS
jgi:hypothetical protein